MFWKLLSCQNMLTLQSGFFLYGSTPLLKRKVLNIPQTVKNPNYTNETIKMKLNILKDVPGSTPMVILSNRMSDWRK